jgi:hypothetical protein
MLKEIKIVNADLPESVDVVNAIPEKRKEIEEVAKCYKGRREAIFGEHTHIVNKYSRETIIEAAQKACIPAIDYCSDKKEQLSTSKETIKELVHVNIKEVVKENFPALTEVDEAQEIYNCILDLTIAILGAVVAHMRIEQEAV